MLRATTSKKESFVSSFGRKGAKNPRSTGLARNREMIRPYEMSTLNSKRVASWKKGFKYERN